MSRLVSCKQMAATTSQWWRRLVNAYEVKAGMVKAVWSIPERFRGSYDGTLYKLTYLYLYVAYRGLQEACGESERMAVQEHRSAGAMLWNDHVDVPRCKAAERRWTNGPDAEHRGKRQHVLLERIQVQNSLNLRNTPNPRTVTENEILLLVSQHKYRHVPFFFT